MNFQNFNSDGTGKPRPFTNVFSSMSQIFINAYSKSVSQMIPDKLIVSPATFRGLKAQLTVVPEYIPPPKPKKPTKLPKEKFKYAASPAYPGAK